MLTGTVYRQVPELNRLVYDVLAQAEAREPADRVARAVQNAFGSL